MPKLSQKALDLLFLEARTRNGWRRKKVPPELLEDIWNIARMGPTSANCQPLRVVFVTSKEAKNKLAPALSAGNREKTMEAPVTAIFAYDLAFYDLLPRLFPHEQRARSWFAGKEPLIQETAFRNGTLQAAYFMLAARARGLDCGPMSGFNQEKVNEAFFSEGTHKVNFICNLGYGTDANLFPRSPRLTFNEAARVE
jgi:3-hydroxypropanoate dehydrogenase